MSDKDRPPDPSDSSNPGTEPGTSDVPTLVDPERAAARPLPPGSALRYRPLRALGKGGMGVVRLCHDAQIGRDVAMKIIREDLRKSPERTRRFLREARVQGQLEHPSIVPVYDMGTDESGTPYFTMKRVRGVTLSRVIAEAAEGRGEGLSRRRLLTAFVSLCRALEYAHVRRVLHRDVKPANVVLGDFGEVYLLDWGLAKVLRGPDVALETITYEEDETLETVAGEMIGTLGYAAPEQARGRVAQLDARTDVYALGCVLFEILALQPLHSGKDRYELLLTTTRGIDARPSARAPERDIPPELDRICVKATALAQAERYPSVRALREEVERFLDGDRNMEMRRDLAAEHTARAEEAVHEALHGRGPSAEQARRRALREVGRALALDPDNERALSTLEKVFTAPPSEVPADVTAQLRVAETRRHRMQIRDAIAADLVGMGVALPFALWMGIRDWTFVLAVIALTAVSIVFKGLAHRSGEGRGLHVHAYLAFLFNALAVAMVARAWGPLFVMPVLLLVFVQGYSTTSVEAHQRRVLLTACAVQVGAVLVEALGLLPPSYSFEGGALAILPRGINHSRTPTLVALTVFSLFMLLVPVRLAGRLQRMLRDAEQRSMVNAWQLGQLLPNRALSLPPEAAPGESGRRGEAARADEPSP